MCPSVTPDPFLSVGPSKASSPRLLVLSVILVQKCPAKRVHAVDTRSGTDLSIILHHDWAELDVQTGHIVRVVLSTADGRFLPWIASKQVSNEIVVDAKRNFFILHPDTLISGTAVSDSFMCLRKSVLSARTPAAFAPDSHVGEAALFGSMIHDLFQIILIKDSNTRDYSTAEELSQAEGVDVMSFYEAVEDVLHGHKDDLFASSIPESHARRVLHKVIPEILDWYKSFMGSGNFRHTDGVSIEIGKVNQRVTVTKVHDIEELVWSPSLGLKGKIDASVHMRVDDEDRGIGVLELKTGKSLGYSAISHIAQVSLYNLMMSERKNSFVRQGLLTYIRYQDALKAVREEDCAHNLGNDKVELSQTLARFDEGPKHRLVVPKREEVVGLLVQRNRIASYLRASADVEDLPPLLTGRTELCQKCFLQDSCMLQHKLLERGTVDTAVGPGKDLFLSKTAHLSPHHATYYYFWRNVLADEQEYAGRHSKGIWTMAGIQKEEMGLCLSNLLLRTSEAHGTSSPHHLLAPGFRLSAQFNRHPTYKDSRSFLSSRISVGDYIVVSAERNVAEGETDNSQTPHTWQVGLANGFVESLSADSVSVLIDRSLTAWILHQGLQVENVTWRIDTEEIFASHSTAKRTLESLFYNEEKSEVAGRLRGLIVDGCTPGFSKLVMSAEAAAQEEKRESGLGVDLNEEQRHALRMSLKANDYLLILGMPGTGKTTTLASLVVTHARMGRSVLLCAHTNTAVDNLLGRILKLGCNDFIRLGRTTKVIDKSILPYHLSQKCGEDTSVEEMGKIVEECPIIATTCLGINHAVLTRRRKFDLVVVDEASQVTQPICIGPLQFCKGAFVLVGDHYQLPPLQRAGPGVGRRISRKKPNVLNQENGEALQSDESLFRRLCDRHPEAMVVLSKQYRMAKEIMDVCNYVVYGGSLQCGTDKVAEQFLSTSHGTAENGVETPRPSSAKNWMTFVRDQKQKVAFLDVKDEPRNDNNIADKSENKSVAEAQVAAACVHELFIQGVLLEDITILSPFRSQVELLKIVLGELGLGGCEVFTVDQYQGKDNKCIIVSFVRSSVNGVGPLLKDWRRINVALTRAKQKLVLIGNAATLKGGGHFLRQLVGYLESKNRMIPVSQTSTSATAGHC